MSFYEARARVEKVAGAHRRVTLETGAQFDTGVNGAIKENYKLLDEKNLTLPVDYIVCATGA